MRLWIGVHLTHPSLDLLCPNWRTKPAVILDQGRVKTCSPAATKAGIQAGMHQSSVNTLCPHAVLAAYQPQLELQALRDTALALLQYTPELTLSEANTVLLDVTASLTLFGGARRLYRRVRSTLDGLGFTAAISMAPTAGGAWLLATTRRAYRRCLQHATLTRRLDRLPCTSLPAARPYNDWLTGIGCETLEALRALPRAGLRRRTSQTVQDALDIAYGQAPELVEWFVPPLQFSQYLQLNENVEHVEALQFLARRLIEQLCGWLVAHQRAASQVVFQFEHEQGRHARAPTGLTLILSTPAWHVHDLLLLFKEHLHTLQLPAPVIAIKLYVTDTQPMAPAATQLFPEPGGTTTDRQRVLDRLIARLGRSNVLHPAPVADHRPEIANRWLPSDQTVPPVNNKQNTQRPFWLLDTPVPLVVKQHRPFYGGALRIVHGPERIEDGWWDAPVMRDYFIAQAQDGTRYWLFQERDQKSGWFLHGLFA